MVLDTSALVAIVLEEPEALALAVAVGSSLVRLVAAPTLVEATSVLLGRKGASGRESLLEFLEIAEVQVVPMSAEAARLACDAYARYGKSVGSPGVLNFGDCLAYGVAMALGEPLLFKGDDFPRTDVVAAPY